jgi:hypothetical protein
LRQHEKALERGKSRGTAEDVGRNARVCFFMKAGTRSTWQTMLKRERTFDS